MLSSLRRSERVEDTNPLRYVMKFKSHVFTGGLLVDSSQSITLNQLFGAPHDMLEHRILGAHGGVGQTVPHVVVEVVLRSITVEERSVVAEPFLMSTMIASYPPLLRFQFCQFF